jgi:hypothetical protein
VSGVIDISLGVPKWTVQQGQILDGGLLKRATMAREWRASSSIQRLWRESRLREPALSQLS